MSPEPTRSVQRQSSSRYATDAAKRFSLCLCGQFKDAGASTRSLGQFGRANPASPPSRRTTKQETQSRQPAAVTLARSIFTLGPMVEEMATFFT
jgi:hypothetical protein